MHKVGYILSDGFQVMAISTQAVFEFANLVADESFYRITNFSVAGGPVKSSLGMTVQTQALSPRLQSDTWMVAGVINPLVAPPNKELLRFIKRAGVRARRVAGLCTGGFMLAEAGLLDGRRATTHWAYAEALQQRHPAVQVEPDRIFIADGMSWTSAGMTAGLDLALAMVQKDLGQDVARQVARRLVMNQQRLGGQSQHSEMLRLTPKSDRIQQALDYARRNLGSPLGVEELAEVAHLSPRQFSRVFSQETGQSPAKAVEGLRLEAARLMIEQSRHSLDTIARETGFRDRRHMREAFIRGFGTPPRSIRQHSRTPKGVER